MSLQAKLEAIRRAVEAQTIACPCVEGPACSSTCSCHNPLMSGGCQVCGPINYREGKLLPGHTAQRIPDPNQRCPMKCPDCRFSVEGRSEDKKVWCLFRTNFEGEAAGGCDRGLPKGKFWEEVPDAH